MSINFDCVETITEERDVEQKIKLKFTTSFILMNNIFIIDLLS